MSGKRSIAAVIVLAGVGAFCAGCEKQPDRVRIGERTWTVEIADSDAERYQGLSGRNNIPTDTGMLFVFPDAAPRTFVMRNCLVPIDVIFIGDDRRVVSLHAMQPQLDLVAQPGPADGKRWKRYPSHAPAKWVLELAGGQIKATGIAVGDDVTLLLADGGQ